MKINSSKICQEIKILGKLFLIIFLISFLIINWNSVSWLFNYRVISHFFSGLKQITADIKSSASAVELIEKENSLEIPKLGVSAPLILVEKESQVEMALDRGVVLFPESSLPGESGQTIILGHSAPAGWPKIKYDWVFSRISELEKNDEIFLYFNHKKYKYLVEKKIFLARGEELPQDLTNSENSLILISCWPPGKDLKRIAIEAK